MLIQAVHDQTVANRKSTFANLDLLILKFMTLGRYPKILFSFFLLLLLIFLTTAVFIVADGLSDEIYQADVAIVPGNTVEITGIPSARLQARLDKTVELYREGLFQQIIVSGGFGSEGFDEAEVMSRYLTDHGIPQDRIYVDHAGNTTLLTAKNSSQIMKQHNWRSALIISQYFHISRTRLAFTLYDITPVYSAHADIFEVRDLYSIVREVFGYFSYSLRSKPN